MDMVASLLMRPPLETQTGIFLIPKLASFYFISSTVLFFTFGPSKGEFLRERDDSLKVLFDKVKILQCDVGKLLILKEVRKFFEPLIRFSI